jgi:hypothetical protein
MKPTKSSASIFHAFYSEDDRNAGLPARVLEIAKTTGKYESEGWRVRKDGSRFWALAVVDAVRDEAGELIGFGGSSMRSSITRSSRLILTGS